MREFRGKRVDNGEWITGYYRCIKWEIDKKTHQIINGNSFFEVDPETVGQYTGLKDKNGQEIYEDDIWREGRGSIAVVTYDEDGFKLDWKINKDFYNDILKIHREYGEVIGNKHDHPHLLGGESNE